MSAPHRAVKHELLVRHLDAWTPMALRGSKPATFVARCDPALTAAAMRVFVEFADLLERHPLRVLLLDAAVDPTWPATPGLSAEPVTALPALVGPAFGFFDATPTGDVTQLASAKLGSALTITAGAIEGFDSAGFRCRAELVAADGSTETLLFTTGVEKSLERFKDELWALDEYAGIKLCDPADPTGTLLDITVEPHLGPLRRELLGMLADGPRTLAEMRDYVLHSTIYRAVDASRAVQAMIHGGACTREPSGGRLSPTTVIIARP
jgi:hypothetical protein